MKLLPLALLGFWNIQCENGPATKAFVCKNGIFLGRPASFDIQTIDL